MMVFEQDCGSYKVQGQCLHCLLGLITYPDADVASLPSNPRQAVQHRRELQFISAAANDG